jgi:hypothetical protein
MELILSFAIVALLFLLFFSLFQYGPAFIQWWRSRSVRRQERERQLAWNQWRADSGYNCPKALSPQDASHKSVSDLTGTTEYWKEFFRRMEE